MTESHLQRYALLAIGWVLYFAGEPLLAMPFFLVPAVWSAVVLFSKLRG